MNVLWVALFSSILLYSVLAVQQVKAAVGDVVSKRTAFEKVRDACLPYLSISAREFEKAAYNEKKEDELVSRAKVALGHKSYDVQTSVARKLKAISFVGGTEDHECNLVNSILDNGLTYHEEKKRHEEEAKKASKKREKLVRNQSFDVRVPKLEDQHNEHGARLKSLEDENLNLRGTVSYLMSILGLKSPVVSELEPVYQELRPKTYLLGGSQKVVDISNHSTTRKLRLSTRI